MLHEQVAIAVVVDPSQTPGVDGSPHSVLHILPTYPINPIGGPRSHLCPERRQIVLCLLSYNLHKIHFFKVHNSVLFRMFTRLCSCHHHLVLEHVYHPQKKPCSALSSDSPLPPAPQPLTSPILLSVDLPVPDISCGWSPTLCMWSSGFGLFHSAPRSIHIPCIRSSFLFFFV